MAILGRGTRVAIPRIGSPTTTRSGPIVMDRYRIRRSNQHGNSNQLYPAIFHQNLLDHQILWQLLKT